MFADVTLYMVPLEVPPWELSEINFICSLIIEHTPWRISHTSLNLKFTLHSPPLKTVIFKAILGERVIICDISWHVPQGWVFLFPVFALSFSVSYFLFFFLCLANQKAKPCRLLKANNNPPSVDVWSWQSDCSSKRENTLWSFLVLKQTQYFSPFFNAFLCFCFLGGFSEI